MKPWTGVIALAVATAALVGCDPAGVPSNPRMAEMDVTLNAEGGADVDLLLGGAPSSSSELRRVGEAVAPALLPGSGPPSVKVDYNEGATPFVRLRAVHAYMPGPHPVFHLDTKAALSVLARLGYRSVQIAVSAPAVPATGTWRPQPDSVDADLWSWRAVTPSEPPPTGTIRLDPRPWRAVGELALTVLAFASLTYAALALRRRRRWRVVIAGLAAGGAAFIIFPTAGGVQGDNLGVVGLMSGAPLTIVAGLPLLALIALPAAIGVIAAAFSRMTPPPASPLNPPRRTSQPPAG